MLALRNSKGKEIIAIECPFTALHYVKLISKSALKSPLEKYFKKNQIRESKHKLLRKTPGTSKYQMGWLRLCGNDYVIMNGSFHMDH